MHSLVQDVRYGLRMLRKSPGFTAVAVLTLALGIGANTTIFSWTHAVLIDPLPGVPEPHRLVAVQPTSKSQRFVSISYPNYVDLRDRTQLLSGLLVTEEEAMSLSSDGRAERVWGELVSGNFFDVLGVRPIVGRTFLPEEDRTPNTHPVVVISERLWERRFARDPGILNQTITLNQHPFTVVGIAPAEFHGSFVGLRYDVWVPIMMQERVLPGGSRLQHRGHNWLVSLGRLKPGVTVEQAQSELQAIAQQIAQEHADEFTLEVYPFWKSPRGAQAILGPVLLALLGMVGVVLLIACANLANLALARATGRRREIAVRLALGASRGQLMRQLLVENLLLALLGGAAAVLMTVWTSGLLVTFVPPTDLPVSLATSATDGAVLLFTLALALLTGLAFGLVPALQAGRGGPMSALKDESGTVAAGHHRLRSILVSAQVTLCLVLLVAASLFLRSLRATQSMDPGFDRSNVLLAAVDLFPNGYTPDRAIQFFTQLLERVNALPGVESATLARRVPLGFGGTSSTTFNIEGYEPAPDEKVWTLLNWVGPDYMQTMRIPLLRGREFTFGDSRDTPRTVVINQHFAERYFPGQDPIGRRVSFDGETWWTVIGVAGNSKFRELNEPQNPFAYLATLQSGRLEAVVHLRSNADPTQLAAAVREQVRALDPNVPVFDVRTLEQHVTASAFQQRLGGTLLSIFGLLALTLAGIGIYAVLAYWVGQRTREIGIRVALGARPRQILRLVLAQALRPVTIGLALGLAAAAGVARLLSSLLFGVGSADVVSYVAVPAALVMVALAASLLPARRATRVDPMVALRYE